MATDAVGSGMSRKALGDDDVSDPVRSGRVVLRLLDAKQSDSIAGVPKDNLLAAGSAKVDNTRTFVRTTSPESRASSKGSFTLPSTASAKLTTQLSRQTSSNSDGGAEEDQGHDHAPKPASLLTAAAAALINFLLMFGLCCAYGLIMLPDDWNSRHRGLAVKMNLATAMLMGLALATFSGVPVAIGGPDLNPVVFLSMFISKIAEKIAQEKGLALPESGAQRRLFDSCDAALRSNDYDLGEVFRRLAGGGSDTGGEEFCTGVHYYGDAMHSDHMADCDAYHAELRATMVFTVMVSSAILGVLYFMLGKFKLTRFVAYIPTNIMEAFLSCIGYKVFKYALKFSKFKPTQFIPAACIGVPLYFVKALHIGNPAVVIPAMLLVPLGIFYAILYGSGMDVHDAREGGWMFDPPLDYIDFWVVWGESVVGRDGGWFSDINFGAWAATLPDLPIMLIVCTMDCLLKLHSTESKLPVKAHKDEEIKLYGMCNALTTISGGSVGYMQLKFNVINAGVMGNVTDRRGGILYALLCGSCWLGTTELFNWMPRFFLSALLFFAGAGFVAENLWGSRKYLSTSEWIQILVILGIFIMLESLLGAVIVGGLIAGSAFIARYAKVPCFTGPIAAFEIPPLTRRCPLQLACIQHIMGTWVVVYNLKGFIFFASASKLIDTLTSRIKSQCDVGSKKHHGIRWLIFDCDQLDGLDSSASKAFSKFAKICKKSSLNVYWTSLPGQVKQQLLSAETIEGSSDCHRSVTDAMLHIESQVVEYAARVQRNFAKLHPRFHMVQDFVTTHEKFEPFRDILGEDARFGCPWAYCGRLEMEAFRTLVWTPGEFNRELLLVHAGKIGLFASIPADTESDDGELGILLGIYGHGKFLNAQALTGCPTRYYAVAIEDGWCLSWDDFQWARMKRERPEITAAIVKAILKQEVFDSAVGKAHLSQTELDPVIGADGQPRSVVPPDMQKALQGLDVAAGLRKLGLYDAIGDSPGNNVVAVTMAIAEELPLPPKVLGSLELAWSTYAIDDDHMALSDLQQALMYAGIFDVLFSVGDEKADLRKEDFMVAARKGIAMQFSKLQAKTCKDIFDTFAGSKGFLTEMDLVDAMQKTIDAHIPCEDLEALASVWADTSDGHLDFVAFLAIMSRLAKQYEIHWHLLCGIEALMGDAMIGLGAQLTLEALVAASKLESETAEEMLWAADVHHALGQGKTLDPKMIAAVLLANHHHAKELPPSPIARMSEPVVALMHEAKSNINVVDTRLVPDKEALWTELDRAHSSASKRREGDDIAEAGPVVACTDGATLMAVNEHEPTAKKTVAKPIPNTLAAKLHLLLEEPNSSTMANKISVIMGVMILISVLTLVLEPLISADTEVSEEEDMVWFVFEAFFTCLFLVEFIIRFLVADALETQTKMDFLKAPMNVCDFIAILPFFVDLVLKDMDQSSLRLFRVARLMRLSRVVRLGRLAKRSAVFAPIALIFVVIWGTYMKNGIKES